ncbi:proteasome subunit alpha type-4-like [Drosophila sechellia]|uniref:Proteasome subunit alpha type n=1 Tax=Drosophila sechellia TaxID=7238 RepID=B4HZZ0_DROSE|nr:proteasome subunit alpha type-4-like [Drosophila sechellia]EDW53597.1 GM12106 [Drosophila sechellia]
MARLYDSRTTIFSPEGRLYQVEYAMEAASQSGTCVGILAKNGVLLATERSVDKLMDTSIPVPRISTLNEDMACCATGNMADGNVLVAQLRLSTQQYLVNFGEMIPCEQLVRSLCDIKQAYTQYGGKRPFGVSFLYMGWDRRFGFQLYQSDPSGNYSGWKVTCIGRKSGAAMEMLQNELFSKGYVCPSLEEAKDVAIKVMGMTLDRGSLTPANLEIASIQRFCDTTVFHMLEKNEIHRLIEKYNILKKRVVRRKYFSH